MEYISFEDIKGLNILPEKCVEWAREVIKIKKDCDLPPKISNKFDENSFFNTMPSIIPALNRFGVKEVSRIPDRNPALKADILLYDTKTGDLLSFMDGTWITTMRTGAVAAIAIDTLKKTDAKNIAFMGLGNTARATLLCLLSIYKDRELNIKLLEYKDQHTDFMKRFSEYKNITSVPAAM